MILKAAYALRILSKAIKLVTLATKEAELVNDHATTIHESNRAEQSVLSGWAGHTLTTLANQMHLRGHVCGRGQSV